MPKHNYDTEKHPRLRYDVLDPTMGIGTLSVSDLEWDPMGVMLQGQVAEDEIRALRNVLKQVLRYGERACIPVPQLLGDTGGKKPPTKEVFVIPNFIVAALKEVVED